MEISNVFVALACSLFLMELRSVENSQKPSLHDAWTQEHTQRTNPTQTTIDTLFLLVKKYQTVAAIAQDYSIDLTLEDRQMISQFSASFKSDKNSYKKRHFCWPLSPEYYFRKQKHSRAKALKNFFINTDNTVSIADTIPAITGSAAHETRPLFATHHHNSP